MTAPVLASRLFRTWQAKGIAAPSAATGPQIAVIENRLQVGLPKPLIEYLSVVNGMRTNTYDEHGFRFWGVDEFELARIGGEPSSVGPSRTRVIFADYSIWTHAYAISSAMGLPEDIALVGGPEPILVASSFEMFLEKYLDDPDALFPGPSLA